MKYTLCRKSEIKFDDILFAGSLKAWLRIRDGQRIGVPVKFLFLKFLKITMTTEQITDVILKIIFIMVGTEFTGICHRCEFHSRSRIYAYWHKFRFLCVTK